MNLDVIIDVVCPWCYVGKRKLEKALDMRPGIISKLTWRPYQLGPDTPAEGIDRATYYKNKFGDGPQVTAARENLRRVGVDLGITFDFESECKIANTLDAHRLIRWALEPGVQGLVVEDLMRRYFEEAAFLGDHDLLVDVAHEAGMDGKQVRELLASERDKDLIQAEIRKAAEMGIQGVPMFVFDGKAGVSGAQDATVLVGVMDKLLAEVAAE